MPPSIQAPQRASEPDFAPQSVTTWPGFDGDFDEVVRLPALSREIAGVSRRIEEDLSRARGWDCAMGLPSLVRPVHAARVHRVAEAFHRALEAVVRSHRTDERVQRAIPTSRSLSADADRDERPTNARIHLCRLDLMLSSAGDFHILEANANCPASLLYGGSAAREWRSYLTSRHVALPGPLGHEHERWAARWFVESALHDTGHRPEFIALLREEGGNRTELTELANQFQLEGIETLEADPRQLTLDGRGGPSLAGRTVRHAYLKLGMREFGRMRPELDAFVEAVRSGALFVQNGQRGRWIGDNKLCLSVLSDPRFRDLFAPEDWTLLRPHIPWSRNAGLCTAGEISRVRACRSQYVLKRPLDTRGRGVLVGREVASDKQWTTAVDRAVRESWLVQEFLPPTQIRTGPPADEAAFHDLSVGVVNGRVGGAFIRSSRELRTNLALSGRLHPVFMGPVQGLS